VALAIGLVLALPCWLIKFIPNKKLRVYLKLVCCVIAAMLFVILEHEASTHDASYVASLTFGYVCFRLWGDEKPSKELATFWFFL